MNDVVVYSHGIMCASVCVREGLTRDEIEASVNVQYPTGIESRWHVSADKFALGESNPSPCEAQANRLHYLLTC